MRSYQMLDSLKDEDVTIRSALQVHGGAAY